MVYTQPMNRLKILIYLFLVAPTLCVAVDPSSLWLPTKYQKNYVALLESAESAESLDRCENVLEATIDLEQSKKKHPIFRILCRQKNGRSYNEMVDGLTFETLTTPKVVVVELTPEELEAQRLKEEKRKKAEIKALKHTFWEKCQKVTQEKALMMTGLVWLTKEEPEPQSYTESIVSNATSTVDDDNSSEDKEPSTSEVKTKVEAVFCIDFDAKSVMGEKLQFQAVCHVDSEDGVEVLFKKR